MQWTERKTHSLTLAACTTPAVLDSTIQHVGNQVPPVYFVLQEDSAIQLGQQVKVPVKNVLQESQAAQ